MASIERTAYPRFRREPSAAELQEFFTPREEEIELAYSFGRSDQTLFVLMVLLKAVQYLGYFPTIV